MVRSIVYVLTSEGNDLYSAMTRISAASIRLSNPRLGIVLVSDRASVEAMARRRDPLLGEIDERLEVAAPEGPPSFRNRFLKTNLRSLLDGPFLFLDSDTLIRGDLSPLLALRADIAAAPNRSRDLISEQIWSGEEDVLRAMGWSTRSDVYVNGGVMLFRDTGPARRFALDWHRKWLASYERGFGYRDQPALNAAIAAANPQLDILPHRFNGQFRSKPQVYRRADIWHYYASRDAKPTTDFELLALELSDGRLLSMSRVQQLVRSCHPWRRDLRYRVWSLTRRLRRQLKPTARALR